MKSGRPRQRPDRRTSWTRILDAAGSNFFRRRTLRRSPGYYAAEAMRASPPVHAGAVRSDCRRAAFLLRADIWHSCESSEEPVPDCDGGPPRLDPPGRHERCGSLAEVRHVAHVQADVLDGRWQRAVSVVGIVRCVLNSSRVCELM